MPGADSASYLPTKAESEVVRGGAGVGCCPVIESSLGAFFRPSRDSVPPSAANPAMNRWAIFGRPGGTCSWTRRQGRWRGLWNPDRDLPCVGRRGPPARRAAELSPAIHRWEKGPPMPPSPRGATERPYPWASPASRPARGLNRPALSAARVGGELVQIAFLWVRMRRRRRRLSGDDLCTEARSPFRCKGTWHAKAAC